MNKNFKPYDPSTYHLNPNKDPHFKIVNSKHWFLIYNVSMA